MSDFLKRVAGEVTGGSWARLMTKEREALLTELSVLIDDQVVPGRHGRGRRPELSDSKLLCLAVAQMLPGHHKRLKPSRGLLCNTMGVVARVCPTWSDDLWITDATPVPCGTSGEGRTIEMTHSKGQWSSASRTSTGKVAPSPRQPLDELRLRSEQTGRRPR